MVMSQQEQSRQDQSPREYQHDSQRQDEQPRYGASSEDLSGTLKEGYGQGEQMGKDQWSQENYDREARDVDEPMLDQKERRGDKDSSDIDSMVGGIVGGSGAGRSPDDVLTGQPPAPMPAGPDTSSAPSRPLTDDEIIERERRLQQQRDDG